MIIIKKGDLVYSFASEEFFIVIEVHGRMCFKVYTMSGQIIEVIDITLTHVEVLSSNYKDKTYIPL
jgi:hypothetical protein